MVTKSSGCFWFPNDMYPVYICFVPDEAGWRKLMRRLRIDNPKPYPTSAGCTSVFERSDEVCSICVAITVHERNDHNPTGIVTVMAHEASHVCDDVLEYIGEKQPGSEQRAYLYEFVMRGLLEAYAKSGRKAPE